MGGSFRAPAKGEDPLLAVLAARERKEHEAEASGSGSSEEGDVVKGKKDQ